MKPEQWDILKQAAKGQPVEKVPLALIIDSPWIPGYLGISHLDYYLDPQVWFQANLQILEEFPEVIFIPSWWVEYGMAIEPAAMGAITQFAKHDTPSVHPVLHRLEDVEQLPPADPRASSFMALALHLYEKQKKRIFDAGYTVPLASARGPLCTAAFLRGVSSFMMDLIENPELTHRLLEKTTAATLAWLKAQAEVIGDSVEGIFLLDDIVGLIGPGNYQEFAHPCLKAICDAFPEDWVKIYHNDAPSTKAILSGLAETGFDVLNWSKAIDLAEARRLVGERLCLMGNVDPLDIGVRGTPQQMEQACLRVLEASGGQGLILSLGGGTSPGMPGENIRAMITALNAFNSARRRV